MHALVRSVEFRVQKFTETQDKAHDWEHIRRVRDMALLIAEKEGGSKLIVELAALIHDIGDRKAHKTEEAGHLLVVELLQESGTPQPLLDQVVDIARRVSFRGLGVLDDMPTLEGKIVQDADRLDAIGAIAIARTFTWGGAKGRTIHDPKEPIFHAQSPDEYYGKGGRTSINHFHEKLLHLKDRLNTNTAWLIAKERHAFMEAFLRQFEHEWNWKV